MPQIRRHRVRTAATVLFVGTLLSMSSCSSSDGADSGGSSELVALRYGRLVDVYGFRTIDGVRTVELFAADVLIGPDIQDERSEAVIRSDEEILYDFVGTDPDDLQQRLLITRSIGSSEFQSGFDRLRRKLTLVAAGRFGQDTSIAPFSVVPRNAALELEFSTDLGVTDEFFYEHDPSTGQVAAVRNTEAVQLLEFRGDPTDVDPVGDFTVIPTRFASRGRFLILDPVLLGSEGARFGMRNSAAGMPAAPDQLGSNIRVAVALAGPLRIRGLHARAAEFVGANNAGDRSVIRDLRSGHPDDNSADIARGFVRDQVPPRIVGEIDMVLAQVATRDRDQFVTLFKNGKEHEIDRGDVIRFLDADGRLFGRAEVIVDPEDDRGRPEVEFVRVSIRGVDGLEALDPGNRPDYPGANSPELVDWLKQHGPVAVVVAEFTANRRDPLSGQVYGDRIEHFITISPEPLPLDNGEPSSPTANVSPFAEVIVRFNKPIDLDSVRPFDTFFIATRNVIDRAVIDAGFLQPRGLDPDRFNYEKFRTPHLVVARALDTSGSQTQVVLQPTRGLYLDQAMRGAAQQDPPVEFPYHLHLVGGPLGITDLAGNAIDFQAEVDVVNALVVPFTLDTRVDSRGVPRFGDNLVVHIVRRFVDPDEDEQPSIHRATEMPRLDPNNGGPLETPAEGYPLQDLFGAASVVDGRLLARPTARVRQIVDDRNQVSPPPQTSDLRHCPEVIGGAGTVATATASVAFGRGIQNPLNPFGARLQTVWREVDLSLSRVDALDFDLDVEQMYWAPFAGSAISYDVFDRVSLFLGHSERRPEPCVGSGAALAALPQSGLISRFVDNYAHNLDPATNAKSLDPAPHPAYVGAQLTIDSQLAFTEPSGSYRYLPLPRFQQPYFVYRDQSLEVQGGDSESGSDVRNANQVMPSYIISPWLSGQGRFVTRPANNLQFNFGRWDNNNQFWIGQNTRTDAFTGGGVSAIALPLLADFWTYPDDPDLPAGNGFRAAGFNGWQIALTVQSGATPNFRAFSGGQAGGPNQDPRPVRPGSSQWDNAAGLDNSIYWVMVDFLKRQSVVTAGFVDLYDPHRRTLASIDPANPDHDPRLGPYFTDVSGNVTLPAELAPRFDFAFDPPLASLPGGTRVTPEFRAASAVDPEPWRYAQQGNQLRWTAPNNEPPNATNFPLDPLKACDAFIRKYDDRQFPGTGAPRNGFSRYYTLHVSDYTVDIADLARDSFTDRFSGPNDSFRARDVRYFNWRFVMVNNVVAQPTIAPSLDSFAITYRFEPR